MLMTLAMKRSSHNPKEYNGYKVYWSDGAQLPPQHAAAIAKELVSLVLAQRGGGEPLFIFLTVIHCMSSCSGISSMGRIRFFASSSIEDGT